MVMALETAGEPNVVERPARKAGTRDMLKLDPAECQKQARGRGQGERRAGGLQRPEDRREEGRTGACFAGRNSGRVPRVSAHILLM